MEKHQSMHEEHNPFPQPARVNDQLAKPMIRLITCGSLTIEVLCPNPLAHRYEPLAAEKLRGRGVAPALTLLKLLESQPHRYATKDWLMEHLRREEEACTTAARLDDIASLLRGLLCPIGIAEKDKLRRQLVQYIHGGRDSGDGYRLADYPLVWLDSDALAWNVEQAARMERFGDDSLPFWERAYQLASRGSYLPDEPYSDWAQARRDEVAGHLRQSVHALARLYQERFGEAGEAQTALLLRSYWQQHPTDEDALRPLMELLGKQERYQEAEECFQKLLMVYQEEGSEQHPDQRTQDIREYLYMKRIQRENEPKKIVEVIKTSPASFAFSIGRESYSRASFPSDVMPNKSGELDLFAIGIMALILHQQKQQWDINELEQRITQALDEKVADMQKDQYMSRRGALSFIAGIPLALYGFAKISGQPSSSLVPEEMIPLYAAGIPACWRLYYESGQSELEHVLPTYLSHLTLLAQTPSKYQKSAAGLLSQTHQLTALIAQGHEDFGRAIEHCKQAAMYGQLAEDANLQAMALIRQQDTYYERKRFTQWFRILKEAESFSESITPLLRGRIYARLSLAYAYQAQLDVAQRYMDLAQATFPTQPETDESFLYNHTTHFVLYANQAFMHLQSGQPYQAWEAITKANESVVGPTNPRKIDITHYQIQVAIELHDLELSCGLFEKLVGFTKQFGQELDMGNTHEVYQQLRMHWLHEKRVLALQEHLQA